MLSSSSEVAGKAAIRFQSVFVALTYVCIVLTMWAPYNLFSGFPYELSFPYFSETHPGWAGFFYQADSLRIQENTFYHLSYLLGEMLHVGGSYVPYQVVLALLWWARGFLAFVLVRKFLPKHLLVAYAAGAFVLIHSADGATEWVGQMNQYGYIFWMLMAFLCVTTAMETRWYYSVPLAALASAFQYMSLWSYESPIVLILVFPVILLLHPRRTWRKFVPLSIAWLVVPIIYLRLTVQQYLTGDHHTYQQSVARKTWEVATILSDWFANASFSLEFWRWIREDWFYSIAVAAILSAICAAIFIAAALMLTRRLSPEEALGSGSQARGRALWLCAAGLALLLLSFPVYLVLAEDRNMWRTQFLSGIAAGLVFAACVWLGVQAIRKVSWRKPVFLSVGAMIAFTGSMSAIQQSEFHRFNWDRHRRFMREVLQVAPTVDPFSFVILTNVPSGYGDPFGDNMWFDLALRLIYPGTIVSGMYFHADGTRAPGDNFIAKGDEWVWDHTGFAPLIASTKMKYVIVVRYDPSGKGVLEKTMPAAVCAPDCSRSDLYDPPALATLPMSPRTRRRYNLKEEDR